VNFITPLLLLLARSIGVIFVFAGVSKLVYQNRFQQTVRALPLPFLNSNGVAALTKTIPWIELSLGAFIIMGAFLPYTAWISIALLWLFSLVALFSVKRGVEIPCSCFGGGSGEVLSIKTIIRNVLIVMVSLPLTMSDRIYPFSIDKYLHSGFNSAYTEELFLVIFIAAIIVGLSFLVAVAKITFAGGNLHD
jgi:hypothetical protein